MLFRVITRRVALILCLSGLAAAGAEPGRRDLTGHVPKVVAALAPIGRLAATNQLRLAIGLPLRNPAELDELLRQIYDPASTNFHKFLTPPEFTARFGPTVADYAAVRKFAENNGFAVTGMSDSRMVLDVQARAADVEKAFHITLRNYRHPREHRDFFAPDTEPSVPTNLPVADMWGLSDYALPHPLSHFADPAKATPATYNGSGVNGSYRGKDFRNAFAPGANLAGRGQVVAVLEMDGYYAADITNYEAQCGYTNVPLTNVLINVTGTPGYSGVANAVLEVSMDIELAIAMAPGLSKVMVYEGNNAYDVFNQIATDNAAKQISCSWTWGTGPATNWKAASGSTLDSLLKKMGTQGQAFFQASGDSDAYTGSQTLNSSTGPIPVDSVYVTSVGGTSLSMNGTGASWASEAVWNWNNSGNPNVGSGGGVSPNYSIPSWQTGISMALNGGSTVNRNIPDVAMPAEAIYVIYNNGTTSGYIGGTSAAAPLWAGFCALINQQSVASGSTTVGFLNPAIYTLAATSNYTNCFHDITVGNNIGSGTAGLYNAVAGYDLCTGLGSPNGTNLINSLVPSPALLSQPFSQNVTNGANIAFSVTAAGAPPLNFQWLFNGTNLADGGNITGSVGNVLSLAAATANNAGNYSLVLSNSYGSVTSSVAVLNIGFAPAFATQPTNLAVFGGSNAVFGVTATGSTNLVYQWRKNGTNLSNSAGISGANSNVLTLAAVTTSSAGNYDLSVTNNYGTAVSSVASLSVVVPPSITSAGWTLLAESAMPTNGVIDPGETVTVNFTLQNQGTLAPGNLVATLQPNAGVLAPSGSQTYGALAGYGGSVGRSFSFTAAGTCGSNLVATLQLQDGTNNLGTVSFTLPLGGVSLVQSFAQNFDGATAPALPAGWLNTNISGTASSWAASTAAFDTAPNSVFISDIASTSENALVSPVISVVSASAQLSFRHNYSFDYHSGSSHAYRDGGVLEIKIGNGAFTDIVSAGGSFVAGGYNNTINTANNNPLNGRSAWVGIYNFWQTVTVNLPASAAGQNIQLRWNCGTDSSNTTSGTGAVGWYVDSISITDGVPSCLSVLTDLAASQSLATNSLSTGQNLVYTLTVTNLGPQLAANVMFADTVPANVTFVSASPGCAYSAGAVVCAIGMLPAAAATNFTVTLAPVAGTVFTNLISVGAITPEINPANNTATLVSTQTVFLPPGGISVGPASQTIQCGGNASFTVSATGALPLSIQWSLDNVPVAGATNTSFSLTNLHLPSPHIIAVTVTNLYGGATSNAIVTVTDTLAPVITLNGTNPMTNELGSAFNDPGVTAYDACAGSVPAITSGTVNINAAGTNVLIYTAGDGNGNTNIAARTVIVRDTTPPVISWSFTNLVLAANTNCGAVTPDVTGTNFILATDLSGAVTISQNPTNNFLLSLGTNLIVITVKDPSGNAAFSTNTILVEDQTPPVILSQPQSQTNLIGTTATFSVAATACTPLAFQWYSNNVALAAPTNGTLTLSNLTLSAAGNYYVVATAFGGSTTSLVATLTVNLLPPAITSVAANPGGTFNLNLTGTPGYTYILEATTNLFPPGIWLPLATNTLGTNGNWPFTDTSATNFPQQFYRLMLAP